MNLAQTLLERLKEHLALPWPENVSPRERVVMVVYPPSDERKLRRLIESGELASEIKTTGHGWAEYDLATVFSGWLAEYELMLRSPLCPQVYFRHEPNTT
jgi:hypothetical protein